MLIELSFAEAKELHGLRFARMLGIQNMREQAFLAAAEERFFAPSLCAGSKKSIPCRFSGGDWQGHKKGPGVSEK